MSRADQDNPIIPVRAARSIVPYASPEMAMTPQVCEPKVHPVQRVPDPKGCLNVAYQLVTGPSPVVEVTWTVAPGFVTRGYAVHGYYNTSGFADPTTEQFERHGSRFLAHRDSGSMEIRLRPGTSFFTFVLVREKAAHAGNYLHLLAGGGPVRRIAAVVQFRVHVDDLTVATRQVKDVTEHVRALTDQQRAMQEYQQEMGLVDEPDPVQRHQDKVKVDLAKKMIERKTVVAAYNEELKEIKSDASLSAAERESEVRRHGQRMIAELRRRGLY